MTGAYFNPTAKAQSRNSFGSLVMGIRPRPRAQERYFILRTGFEDEPERPCPQLRRPLPRTTTATHDPPERPTWPTTPNTKYHQRHTPTRDRHLPPQHSYPSSSTRSLPKKTPRGKNRKLTITAAVTEADDETARIRLAGVKDSTYNYVQDTPVQLHMRSNP